MTTSKIIGFEKLHKQLSDMGAAAGGKALRSATLGSSLPALRAIQLAAPVGTRPHRSYKGRLVMPGFLKRHIRRMSFLSRDRTRAYVLIGPTQEAFYAQFLELGKKGFARRPFMEPAFQASIPQVRERMREKLKQLIDKAAKK